MSIQILKAGILDTVQDLGRFGFSHWGVNPGGAMDLHAARVANMLVDNDPGWALLEIHFPAPQILFEQTALVSICGADFCPMISSTAVPLWQPVIIPKNSILYFDRPVWGARAYIAFHGGLDIPEWLGGSGTHLKAGAGGWEGRKLERFDQIHLGETQLYYPGWQKEDLPFTTIPWKAGMNDIYHPLLEIRLLPGPEWSELNGQSQTKLETDLFFIDPRSDRMGYYLKGPALERTASTEMLSAGVTRGTMQLLPDGQCILLMADHQTVGGYPRIAQVVAADWAKLAQIKPGHSIKFRMISMEEAETLWIDQEEGRLLMQKSCKTNYSKWISAV